MHTARIDLGPVSTGYHRDKTQDGDRATWVGPQFTLTGEQNATGYWFNQGNRPQRCRYIVSVLSMSYCETDTGGIRDLFVCGISLTSGQLINELFPDCTRSCFSQVVLCRRAVTVSMR